MSANGFLPWGVSDFNALVLFNPAEHATSYTRDAFVQAGRTVTGRIVRPDDQPVTGVTAFGLRGYRFTSEYVAQTTFTLSQLNPKETRKLVFLYASGPTPTRTDRDGRFRVGNLIPGESYVVHRRVNRPVLYFQTCFGPFTVKSGEVKNLGQAKIKRDR